MNRFTLCFIQSNQKTPFDFGNVILYDLCSKYPSHNDNSVIIAKTMFIGRIYAAAIERKQTKMPNMPTGDEFYKKAVVDTFKNKGLDDLLNKLKNIDNNSIQLILEVHKKLVDDLYEITRLNKRSFISKYLHFHFPDLFFLYDSRALEAIRTLRIKLPTQYSQFIKNENVDREYANFYCKCRWLQVFLKDKYNLPPESITPRIIDNMLISRSSQS
jgi:hypothetical protein